MQKILEKSISQEKKQMNNTYFIDTNILIYLLNKNEKEKHEIVKKIIKTKNCNISIQNLKELSNILFKKTNLSNSEIKKNILIIGKKFTLLAEISTDILNAINYSTKRNNFYDSLLISTMKRNRIKNIITENEKDFEEFKEINVINPFKEKFI